MPHDHLIGRQLANFRIERMIGRGGMAEVYYGWDVKLHRPVAIKVIDARFRNDPSYAERFVREARTVAKWRHENILQIYYADDEEGLYYFVMEYIEGQDLGEWLQKHRKAGKPIAPADVARIGGVIASALDYAHRQGVIHRDVKPANVMMADDGRIVLADFGLSMHVSAGSLGEVFGSAHYVSPEQARRSADAVPASDLYSLGVILYEMLVGAVPFDDPSPTSVALQHVTLEVPLPRDGNSALSLETEKVLLKALSKSPADRYPNAQLLVRALSQALHVHAAPAAPAKAKIALPPPPALVADAGPPAAVISPAPAAANTPAPAALPAPRGTPAPGTLLGQQIDEYRLETLLGKGGMARVYRGFDLKLNRYVAIKVIDAPFRKDADHIMRFEREAHAIGQLEHNHIVRLYYSGEADGLLYMAMQYVKGSDLHYVLDSYRKEDDFIPLDEVARIVQEICEALDYMHSRKVIHRDLTPSNIMLDEDGHVVLTDFGLALMTNVGTRGEIFGSPHYIAPEQAISSAGAVPQSDLYAVGVLLYEMLTGEVPFDANEPLEIARLHMSETPPALREIRPEISVALEAVVLKTLSKNPRDRYSTGAALTNAFLRALKNTDLSAASRDIVQSIPERVASQLAENPLPTIPEAATPEKKPKRSFWRYTLSTLLIAAVVVVAWFAFVSDSSPFFQGAFSPPQPTATLSAPVGGDDLETAASSAPTDPPTPTLAPTRPPTASPEPTATLQPTAVPTGTSTPNPSPTPTVSPGPTATGTPPTPLPTETVSPTETPTPWHTASPVLSPTPLPLPVVITLRERDNMPMARIPGGTFRMGAADDDPRAAADERPQHLVQLDTYHIDQYEVSVEQYAAFLTARGGHAPQACLSYTCLRTQFEVLDSHITWDGGTMYNPEPGFADYPVNYVTWYGAQAYCEWVGGRLPTEAEWEYAARGVDGRRYPWGDEPPDETRAVFGQSAFSALQPVDALPEGGSFFDVYGMAGGVWEWVSDWYSATYYTIEIALNPTGLESGDRHTPHVLRGGGWDSSVDDLRASARWAAPPLDFAAFGSSTGFRCVLPVDGR